MRKILYGILLSVVVCCCAVIAAGCNEQPLAKPTGLYIDETTLDLSWNTVKDAKGYVVNVNGTDRSTVSGKKYSLESLEAGNYTIKIKALSGVKTFKNSPYSAPVTFVRAQESGLAYKLINNNTEYAVSGVKNSKLTEFSTGTEYRGKPVTAIYKSALASNFSVKKITIESTVNEIGESAFAGSGVETVILKNGVEVIGVKAFKSCSELKTIEIPDSVKTISAYAFSYCSSLESVSFGKGVTELADHAFASCSKLAEITLPANVRTVGNACFEKCRKLTKVTLGDGIISLGEQAFMNCELLTEVNMGNSLQELGNAAFYACRSLKEITLAPSLKTIGEQAFCKCTQLATVKIGDQVESIGGYAFEDTAIWKNAEGDVVYIGDDENPQKWIVGCKNMLTEDVSSVMNTSIVGIADKSFFLCEKIVEVGLPDTLRYVGKYAFSGCSGLVGVLMSKNVINIDDYAFASCTILATFSDTNTLERIGNYAFYNCKVLKSINLPDTVKEIGTYAFNKSGLWKSTGIVYVGDWVVGVSSIPENDESKIVADVKEGTVGISNYAFYNSDIDKVVIPSSVKYIGYAAFYGSMLEEAVLPSTLSYLPDFAFYKCIGLNIKELNVKKIGKMAFAGCESITSLYLRGVEELGEFAFFNCNGLESLTVTDIKTINKKAFYSCLGLKTVILQNVVEVDDYAFYKCSSLEDVAFGSAIERIGKYAFASCEKIKELDFGGGKLKRIEENAFYKCVGA